MRTIGIMMVLISILSGCTNNGLKTIYVHGQVVSEVTGEGVANTTVYARVKSYGGSGILSYSNEVSLYEAVTNDEGFFLAEMDYEDDSNIFLFDKGDDAICTPILSVKKNFYFEEVRDNQPLVLEVRKYQELEIGVKNADPFDENDAISVSIYYRTFGGYSNNVFYDIENFGDPNQPRTPPAGEDGNNPYWIGDNVNSVIYGRVQEYKSFVIKWHVKKNGVMRNYQSDLIIPAPNEKIRYDINY